MLILTIDGSALEGGGQMLRTSLGLSALTGIPFKMINIRKGRESSGLKEQHLQAVNAMAELCDAEVKGNKLHSEEIEFYPRKITKNRLYIRISTAGSIGLVLQALLIPAVKNDLEITIEGGATFGKWAAPVDHLKLVLIPLLRKMGYNATIEVKKEGFYPKGGAMVNVTSKKAGLKKVSFEHKGKIMSIKGISAASESLRKSKVAERQAETAKNALEKEFGIMADIKIVYSNSICPGSAIQLAAETESSIIGGNALGERGKKAEEVGKEAAEALINEFNKGAVDCKTADQLLPYFAIANGGSLLTSRITNHIRSNIFVIEKFLPVKFSINENIGEVKLL